MTDEICLLCLPLGASPVDAIARARRLLQPRRVHLLAHSRRSPAWPWGALTSGRDEEDPVSEIAPIAAWVADVDAERVDDLDLSTLRRKASAVAATIVVLGRTGGAAPVSPGWLADAASALQRPVMHLGAAAPARGAGRRVICPYSGEGRELAAVASWLAGWGRPEDELTLLAVGAEDPLDGAADALAELTGLRCRVATRRLEPAPSGLAARFLAATAGHELMLVSAAELAGWSGWLLRLLTRDLLGRLGPSLLMLPDAVVERDGELAAADVLDSGVGPLCIAVEQVGVLGQPGDVLAEALTVVAGGRELTRTAPRGRVLRVPRAALAAAARARVLGLGRCAAAGDGVAAIEQPLRWIRPAGRALALLDAAAEPELLARAVGRLAAVAPPQGDWLALAVRLDPDQGLAGLREGLDAAGLDRLPLVDAGAVLDDGGPDDVPAGLESVRLARVAAWLRAAGHAVELVAGGADAAPATPRAAGWTVAGLAEADPRALSARLATVPRPAPPGLDGMLIELTGATARAGNRVQVELDGRIARERLLGLIAGAHERVHCQMFIVRDGPLLDEVGGALQAAARRGVLVRLLVDALWTAHGNFGLEHPRLTVLDAEPGIEVISSRPLDGVPWLDDLKRRDHRKLWTFDGQRALIGGRNLADSYFRGFAEVALTPATPQHEVPWLDADAEVAGPVVADIERAFLTAWRAAGGASYEIAEVAPDGPARARLVLHEGMREAFTADAYLALVRSARERIVIVNTFPFHKELCHALLDALRRGVAVRLLLGNVRARHGTPPEPFPGGVIRELANQVIHGRVDALVEAGAAVHEVMIDPQPGWDPAVGVLLPHVHAKLVSVDGRVCTVGSANLDISAGYWDDEALLVIEDPALATALERVLEALAARSPRVDRADPDWQSRASWRAWLAEHWPSILQ